MTDIVYRARSLCDEIAGEIDEDGKEQRGSIEIATVLVGEVESLRAERDELKRAMEEWYGRWFEAEEKCDKWRIRAEKSNTALAIVHEQAEDEGLWFLAATASEAYLQQELRRLHAAVEASAQEERKDELVAQRKWIEGSDDSNPGWWWYEDVDAAEPLRDGHTPLYTHPRRECAHRIADARNQAVASGYVCVDCHAVFEAADHGPRRELSEEEIVACLTEAKCHDKVMLYYETGPYSITRPTNAAVALVRAIERKVWG